MAAQRTLRVPALLEHILLQLPIKDLLFAQKICRPWKQAIETSPKLQQALSLKPKQVTGHLRSKDVSLNPLISRNAPLDDVEAAEVHLLGEQNVFLRSFHLSLGPHDLPLEASCHDMLVYQPHCSPRTIGACIGAAMRDKNTDGLMLVAMPDFFSDTCSATRMLGDLFNAVEKARNTRNKGQPKLVLTLEGRLSTVGL